MHLLTLKIILGVIFVITSGAVFTDRFRKNKILLILSSVIALISSYYLFDAVYNDINKNNNIKITKEEILEAIKPEGSQHIDDDFFNKYRPGKSLDYYEHYLGAPVNRYGKRSTYNTDDAQIQIVTEKGTVLSVMLIPTNIKTASRFQLYGKDNNPYEATNKKFGDIAFGDLMNKESSLLSIYYSWGGNGMCVNELYTRQSYPSSHGGGGLRIGNIYPDPCDIPPIDVEVEGTSDLWKVKLPFSEEVSGKKAVKAFDIIKKSKINFIEFTLY